MSALDEARSKRVRSSRLETSPTQINGPLVRDATAKWPRPMAPAAYRGLVGRFVRAVSESSEADPVALLVQFLLFVGSAIGRTMYATVEGDRHYLNEFAVLVGQSAKARKGTSWSRVKKIAQLTDFHWSDKCVQSGLSSSEGLIWQVRDPTEKSERVKERGQAPRYEMVQTDLGIGDKRLFVLESEFASVLKQTERQGNTLSAVLRQAWETGTLRSMTKTSPGQATDAHVSIVGHITREELCRYLTATESANGFGNRFLWLLVKRSKLLPNGGTVNQAELAEVAREVSEAIRFANAVGEVCRDNEANDLWREVYPILSRDRYGLAGHLTARAEAHTLRLSLIYAALDRSSAVRAEHLRAALAVWDYADESVQCLFGDSTGNPLADTILALLRESTTGLTRTEIRDKVGKNMAAERIENALGLLSGQSLARVEHHDTSGRPAERWCTSGVSRV
ncbi:hypothetical protein J8F10_30140 [Gemmata sp. G18]|uniref:DUF3987 domain-containing protein n=1 Tax=Gemmata palustris TaxID=2822762 RepID=A0ABS5C0N5_9BACT|nr:hypothetical protein [Gemmata palustris]MBP3959526.1 hypothetical protein [Gemmata palustris]